MTPSDSDLSGEVVSIKSLQSFTPARFASKPADSPPLKEVSPPSLLSRSAVLIVEYLDRFLRHRLRICEFSDQSACLFRISRSQSSAFVSLADGTEIKSGDPVLELHFWNEHLGLVGDPAATFAWGLRLLKHLRFSLILLAVYLEDGEEWTGIHAVHARFVTCLQRPERAIRHLGFFITSPSRSMGRRVRDYFEDFLVHALVWAFRPCGRNHFRKDLKRLDLWLSTASLKKLYGRPEAANRETPDCTATPVLDNASCQPNGTDA
jgi:hypothetical protein